MPEAQKFIVEISRVEEPISEYDVFLAVRRVNVKAWVKVTRQK